MAFGWIILIGSYRFVTYICIYSSETAHLSVMYDSAIGMSESMTTGTDPGDYYAHTISGTESEVSDHSTLSKVRGKRHLKNDGVRR